MQPCRVSYAALVDYQEHYCDPVSTREMQHHLEQGCEACRKRLVELQRLLSGLSSRDLMEAPAYVYTKLKAAFRDRYQPGPQRPRLIARPVFDTRLRPSFAGARGAAGDTFQVVHSTAEHDIHLWAEQQNEQDWYLIGQVLRNDAEESLVPERAELQSASGSLFTAKYDGAEFHLRSIPEGSYTLQLVLPAGEVLVPGIVVGN